MAKQIYITQCKITVENLFNFLKLNLEFILHNVRLQ